MEEIREMNSMRKYDKSYGVSLMELAICLIIFVVISVAFTSALVNSSVAQLSQRVHAHQHSLTMNMVESIRRDLRTAADVKVPNINTLEITQSGNQKITYLFKEGVLARNGKSFEAGLNGQNKLQCGKSPSFEAIGNPIHVVVLKNMCIKDTGTAKTALHREFSTESFRVFDTSFEVSANTTFQ
jgi:hypothetical protein